MVNKTKSDDLLTGFVLGVTLGIVGFVVYNNLDKKGKLDKIKKDIKTVFNKYKKYEFSKK